jgi:hypothetical protein
VGFPDTNYAYTIQCGVTINSLADFARMASKTQQILRFYSMAAGSAQGQSSDCTVVFFSTNPLS